MDSAHFYGACSSHDVGYGVETYIRARPQPPLGADNLFVVLNQRKNVDAGEFFAAVEEGELDGQGCAFDDAAELLDEFYSGGGGASSGEQIVADNDALAGLHGVFMNFERVRAVLERVGNAGGLGGKLLWLANGNEACAEPVGQGGGENEAARLDSRDDVNRVTFVVLAETVDQQM